jgi:hypothetical protein
MKFLQSVEQDFWWDVAKQCDYATFFHTPLWQEFALRTHHEYSDASIGAILPSGVRVVFPLLRIQRYGPFQRLLSSFEHCYGGIIADGPVAPAEAARIYRRAGDWRTLSLRYLENPLAPQYPIAIGLDPLHDTTQIVALDADFETVFARFDKKHRHAYRRGIQDGVQVRPAVTIEDFRAYFGAYRDTVDRWGKPADYGYGWELFEHCHALSLSHPELIKLWVTVVDQHVVGGTLAFYWGRHCVAWHGAMYREYLRHRAMNVVDTEIIRDAITRGYRYYDFNPSAGMTGLQGYKGRFGAIERPVTHYRYESPLIKRGLRIYRRVRYGTASWELGGAPASVQAQS